VTGLSLARQLRTSRGVAFVALLAVLVAYYVVAHRLPEMTLGWEVVLLGAVLIPGIFGLVWLALPLWRANGLLPVGAALGALAAVCELAGLDLVADFSKLGALTLFAFWFMSLFETAVWVMIVALIIPAVDAFSVFRGPTGHVIEERPGIFETISFGFPVPGRRDILLDWEEPQVAAVRGYNVYRVSSRGATRREPLNGDELIEGTSYALDGVPTGGKRSYIVESVETNGRKSPSPPVPAPQPGDDSAAAPQPSARAPQEVSATAEGSFARLGPPDILFFGLFLAAAARFGLRVGWTWAAMAASFGLTLALAVWFDVRGLPALPLLSFGFLLPNADLLWRQVRRTRSRLAADE
jgi:hypothetical protein